MKTQYIHKRVGGVAAVAMLGRHGQVTDVAIHVTKADGEPCDFLGGQPCGIYTSDLLDSVDGQVLSRAEIDRLLQRALKRALLHQGRHGRYWAR